VGLPPKCLPAAGAVWFSNEERPTGTFPPSGSKEERAPRSESGVPWRFLAGDPGGAHDRHHRNRSPPGDAHHSRRRKRRGRAGHRHDPGHPTTGRQPARVGRPLRTAHLGHRVSGRARLPARPAARRCRRARARRAGHLGLEGASARDGRVGRERSQRRPLGGQRRPADPRTALGPGRRSCRAAPAPGHAESGHRRPSDEVGKSPPRPARRTLGRGNRQGTQRFRRRRAARCP
jgi:hypothetical protein